MFLFLTDCLSNVFSYLTLYELKNILVTCKELNNIYNESYYIWMEIIKRDFSVVDLNRYSIEDVVKLECGLVCFKCFNEKKNFHHKCKDEINISKLFDEYYITKKMMSSVLPMGKKSSLKRIEILKFISGYFNGLTNYFIYKNNESEKRMNKQKKHHLKMIRKFDRFQNWKLQYYLHNLKFVNHSSDEERKKIIIDELEKFGLEIRNDSRLCQEYIRGNVLLFCAEFIAGIMKITSYLFSYNFQIYNIFHTKLRDLLLYKMFLNENNVNFTFKDGVEYVLRKNKKKILKFYEKIKV